MDGQGVDGDGMAVENVEQGAQGVDAAVARDLEGECLVVPQAYVQHLGGAGEFGRVEEAEPDVAAGDESLELVGRALGDDPAAVEDGDAVGELVGLLQVLRGEEDGDAAVDEIADDLPHGVPGARVESGGRLIEEDHLG